MKKSKFSGYAKWGYIFCIPFFLAYAIFQLYPTLYTIVIGFTDLKGVKKTSDTYNSIKWSVAKNISKGYAAQENSPAEYQSDFEAPCFGTTMGCQRQDLIVFLYRYAK